MFLTSKQRMEKRYQRRWCHAMVHAQIVRNHRFRNWQRSWRWELKVEKDEYEDLSKRNLFDYQSHEKHRDWANVSFCPMIQLAFSELLERPSSLLVLLQRCTPANCTKSLLTPNWLDSNTDPSGEEGNRRDCIAKRHYIRRTEREWWRPQRRSESRFCSVHAAPSPDRSRWNSLAMLVERRGDNDHFLQGSTIVRTSNGQDLRYGDGTRSSCSQRGWPIVEMRSSVEAVCRHNGCIERLESRRRAHQGSKADGDDIDEMTFNSSPADQRRDRATLDQ